MNELDDFDELEEASMLPEEDASYGAENADIQKLGETVGNIPQELAVTEKENGKELEEEEPKKPFSELLDWASCLVYAVALMLAVNLFFFRSITVRGDSMNDTLVDSDQVVVTNFLYKPSCGDIVVIQANKLPVQGTELYGEPIIKRVIALAGDTVRIDYIKGEVYRNGELLSEDYIKELTHLQGFGYMESGVDYVVPENCVFVMGDNRNVSNDSRNLRDVGFIDTDMIIGKAVVRFSPIKDFKWL